MATLLDSALVKLTKKTSTLLPREISAVLRNFENFTIKQRNLFKRYLATRSISPAQQKAIIDIDPKFAISSLHEVSPKVQLYFLKSYNKFRGFMFKRLPGYAEVDTGILNSVFRHKNTNERLIGSILKKLHDSKSVMAALKKYPNCLKYVGTKVKLSAEAQLMVVKSNPLLIKFLSTPLAATKLAAIETRKKLRAQKAEDKTAPTEETNLKEIEIEDDKSNEAPEKTEEPKAKPVRKAKQVKEVENEQPAKKKAEEPAVKEKEIEIDDENTDGEESDDEVKAPTPARRRKPKVVKEETPVAKDTAEAEPESQPEEAEVKVKAKPKAKAKPTKEVEPKAEPKKANDEIDLDEETDDEVAVTKKPAKPKAKAETNKSKEREIVIDDEDNEDESDDEVAVTKKPAKSKAKAETKPDVDEDLDEEDTSPEDLDDDETDDTVAVKAKPKSKSKGKPEEKVNAKPKAKSDDDDEDFDDLPVKSKMFEDLDDEDLYDDNINGQIDIPREEAFSADEEEPVRKEKPKFLDPNDEKEFVNLVKLGAKRLFADAEFIAAHPEGEIDKNVIVNNILKRDVLSRYIKKAELVDKFKLLSMAQKREILDLAFPVETIKFSAMAASSKGGSVYDRITRSLGIAVSNPGDTLSQVRKVLRDYGGVIKESTKDEYEANSGSCEAYYVSFYFKNPNELSYLYVDPSLKNVEVSRNKITH